MNDFVPAKMHVFVMYNQKDGPCPVGIEWENKIGVSDSQLMGVLALLGHDPISDDPVSVGGKRLWWWFEDDHQMTIRKLVTAYFGYWQGDTGHISFVRACFEKAKGFSQIAKQKQSNAFNDVPLTLRRL